MKLAPTRVQAGQAATQARPLFFLHTSAGISDRTSNLHSTFLTRPRCVSSPHGAFVCELE